MRAFDMMVTAHRKIEAWSSDLEHEKDPLEIVMVKKILAVWKRLFGEMQKHAQRLLPSLIDELTRVNNEIMKESDPMIRQCRDTGKRQRMMIEADYRWGRDVKFLMKDINDCFRGQYGESSALEQIQKKWNEQMEEWCAIDEPMLESVRQDLRDRKTERFKQMLLSDDLSNSMLW